MLEAHACGLALISNAMVPPSAMSACVNTGVVSARPFTDRLSMYGFDGAPLDVMTSGCGAFGKSSVTLSKKGLYRM